MDREIRQAIRFVSDQMMERAEELSRFTEAGIKAFVEEQIGSVHSLKMADEALLASVKDAGGLLCVDGSYNRMGGAAPHYLEIYRGVGLCTTQADALVTRVDVTTPLTDAVQEVDFSFGERSKESEAKLAQIELHTAIALVQEHPGYGLVMDGSLIRYAILCPALWETLRTTCEKKDLPLVGVIEDIKTDGIGRELQRMGKASRIHFDRELLKGKLKKGEVIQVAETFPGKSERGLSTMFARFSNQPHVIGVDMAGYDPARLLEIARVLYAVTPAHGRGVPGLLDLVDEKARITDLQMRELLGAYVEPEVLETYFFSMRSKRRG